MTNRTSDGDVYIFVEDYVILRGQSVGRSARLSTLHDLIVFGCHTSDSPSLHQAHSILIFQTYIHLLEKILIEVFMC